MNYLTDGVKLTLIIMISYITVKQILKASIKCDFNGNYFTVKMHSLQVGLTSEC